MSNDRKPENRKGKNVQSGKLLLKKQQISRQQLGGVTGGGEVSALASGAVSIIVSASSSTLETPVGVISGAASGAVSAYDSNHLEDELKDGSLQRATNKAAGDVNNWMHKNLHISW